MTDPRHDDPLNYEYLRRGEALGSDIWGWVLGTGAAVVIGFLILASFSNTTNNNTNTASNNAPNATSNSPPRIGPSNPGSGAQPERPTPLIHGGPSR